jgi:pimeloyl-ACP methyl ester carboxylesterase
VLYIDGSGTPLGLPAADLEERLQILRAQRVTIARAGHHPHLEQPEAFTAAVLSFLSRAAL